MKKKRSLDPAGLPKMSETLLAFARPLLEQLPDPPTATALQNVMTIASLVWNVPQYEKAGHPRAAEYRVALESVSASMPVEDQRVLATMLKARTTTYANDPRLAFAEVAAQPDGRAEVKATAFLLSQGVSVS